MKRVDNEFFVQDAVVVAEKLLGKVITCNGCSGIIVETEAYKKDPASHAYRITPRSEIMLTSYGKWYIYFVYGMYHCLNVTTNGSNEAGAVLIRALEPVTGVDKMKWRRGIDDLYNLCSGPGKLCGALGIDKSLNGTGIDGPITLSEPDIVSKLKIIRMPRIGIREAVHLPWRFLIAGNRFVSRAAKIKC